MVGFLQSKEEQEALENVSTVYFNDESNEIFTKNEF